jgi:hypothetical protein
VAQAVTPSKDYRYRRNYVACQRLSTLAKLEMIADPEWDADDDVPLQLLRAPSPVRNAEGVGLPGHCSLEFPSQLWVVLLRSMAGPPCQCKTCSIAPDCQSLGGLQLLPTHPRVYQVAKVGSRFNTAQFPKAEDR